MADKELQAKEKQAIDKTEGEPTKRGVYFTPLVDIYENKDGITIKADVPGTEEGNVDIDLREGVLTMTATVEPPENKGKLVYGEYDIGGYTRSFRVGKAIDQNKITGDLSNGVLTVFLPKAEHLKPRKIQVQTK